VVVVDVLVVRNGTDNWRKRATFCIHGILGLCAGLTRTSEIERKYQQKCNQNRQRHQMNLDGILQTIIVTLTLASLLISFLDIIRSKVHTPRIQCPEDIRYSRFDTPHPKLLYFMS